MDTRPFEERYHQIPCEHPIYKSGYRVRVSESIRDIHCDSPVAGKVVRVCKGVRTYSDDLDLQKIIDLDRPRNTLVPVECLEVKGGMLYVELEYVSFVDVQ